jgi:hypothetical protein
MRIKPLQLTAGRWGSELGRPPAAVPWHVAAVGRYSVAEMRPQLSGHPLGGNETFRRFP